jgi:two-component system, LytTR family, response regulator AgrA
MKLAILEDDSLQREHLLKSIRNYALFQEPSIEIIVCTDKPNELLQHKEYTQIDCYLLDIELNGPIDGMEVAQTIRRENPFSQIIFVTGHAERLPLTFTYKLAALDFIIKRTPDQITLDVIKALQAASDYYKQIGKIDVSRYFQIKVGEKIKNIKQQDIYYIESSLHPHKLELQEKNGRHVFYGKLKELDVLSDIFFRCHKSCTINLNHVVELDLKKRCVIMTNGKACPVSFRLIRDLHKAIKSLANETLI